MFLRNKENIKHVPLPKPHVMEDYRPAECRVSCDLSLDTELPIHASKTFNLTHVLFGKHIRHGHYTEHKIPLQPERDA
jgi:hypothetical protein